MCFCNAMPFIDMRESKLDFSVTFPDFVYPKLYRAKKIIEGRYNFLILFIQNSIVHSHQQPYTNVLFSVGSRYGLNRWV